MYTKLLRKLVKFHQKISGHCDADGGSGGYGHCS